MCLIAWLCNNYQSQLPSAQNSYEGYGIWFEKQFNPADNHLVNLGKVILTACNQKHWFILYGCYKELGDVYCMTICPQGNKTRCCEIFDKKSIIQHHQKKKEKNTPQRRTAAVRLNQVFMVLVTLNHTLTMNEWPPQNWCIYLYNQHFDPYSSLASFRFFSCFKSNNFIKFCGTGQKAYIERK